MHGSIETLASYGFPLPLDWPLAEPLAGLFTGQSATRYPGAPVAAPLANLPPPATEARPPAVAWMTVPPMRWPRSLNGCYGLARNMGLTFELRTNYL